MRALSSLLDNFGLRLEVNLRHWRSSSTIIDPVISQVLKGCSQTTSYKKMILYFSAGQRSW